ncbi:MAG: squalene--hopene cyclase [Thermodesulfobacteriota bacterium]|nr:MAG: squalene--hopene cyclase [Thermodesulfobacteriota bacterium]
MSSDERFKSACSGKKHLRVAYPREQSVLESPTAPVTLDGALKGACENILTRRDPGGFWVFDLEADATIPSEFLILNRFMGIDVEDGIKERLAGYIRSRQLPDGGWSLYEGGFSDLSVTVKAYFALKLSGDSPNAAHMVSARRLILSLGGAARVNVFTRITLALFGQIPWRTVPAMPVQMMLLPRWFFFHMTKVSYWSRTVIAPLLVLYAKRPVCKLGPGEGLAELFVEPAEKLRRIDRFIPGSPRKNFFLLVDRALKRADFISKRLLSERALKRAEAFTIERMGEGGLGAIFPAMANAVMALKVLGYPEDDPHMARGLKALNGLIIDNGDYALCQPCLSPVWDTCLSLSALHEAGVRRGHRASRDAVKWLFDKQVMVPGDWAVKASNLEPGGWAFQFENSFYPDLDDTAMVLMSLLRAGALEKEEYRERIARAVNWIIGMQNSDGGWGAFDIDNNRLYLNDIPFADHGALLDPSTSDVTGRCIELFSMLGFSRDFPPVKRAMEFLRREQEEWGGWFGRWGVNYIYGTWSVLAGLSRANEDMNAPYIRKAVEWLKSCQNPDGGWGETCLSYNDQSLAGRGESTPSQTSWALLGLMAAGEVASGSVIRGVNYLLDSQDPGGGWDESLYTGTGFPRVFYLRYHGYSQYFPLWALGVYRRLKDGKKTCQDKVTLSSPADLRLPALKK